MARSALALGMLAIAFPAPVFGAVFISEVAWMGTAVSTADEWIELHNDGSAAVSLSGWRLRSAEATPSPDIALSGEIAAGGYYLIERTDDDSVPGIPADLVTSFGGGLSNAGETLLLVDTAGVTVDTVSGASAWAGIGGDAATKATAQRSGEVWTTAAATPRAPLAGAIAPSTTQVSGGASSGGPMQTLEAGTLTIDLPKTLSVFAGADTLFEAVATDAQGREAQTATYRWNFGNGVSRTGARVYYAYPFPGEYLATLSVLDGLNTGNARVVVSVRASEVRVGQMTKDALFVENRSELPADISRWMLIQGDRSIVFPEGTVLPGKRAVPLAHLDTQFLPGVPVMLAYPNGTPVRHDGEVEGVRYAIPLESVPLPARALPAPRMSAAVPTSEPDRVASELPVPETPKAPAAVASSGPAPRLLWGLAAALFVAIAGVSVILARRYGNSIP